MAGGAITTLVVAHQVPADRVLMVLSMRALEPFIFQFAATIVPRSLPIFKIKKNKFR